MTDFDREEAAFRTALAEHAEDVEPTPFRTRHVHWRAPLLIAVTVLAVVGAANGIAGTKGHKTDQPPMAGAGLDNAQWIGIRNIEVQAPGGWKPVYEPGRPDCIRVANDAPVDPALASQGQLVIGDPGMAVTAQACFRKPTSEDPDRRFGQLPFPLWHPYVKLERARPDMAEQQPMYRDGTVEFHGWRLTRKTFDGVQVSVLSAPGDDGLGAAVLATVRRVEVNALGCPTEASVLNRAVDLDGTPLPTADAISAVTVCDYVQYFQDGSGLRGSRRITGQAAKDLVTAIHDAPEGVGPQTPDTCLDENPARRALLLRFLGPDGAAITEARVYFDSCVGNTILEPGGQHQLTAADCKPLFTDPPIGMFGAEGAVFKVCYPGPQSVGDSYPG
jgi:hypothetical protein